MNGIMDLLREKLGGSAMGEISRALGTDEGRARSAAESALPLLVGALARNASNEDGARALAEAVERDHDDGILDDPAQLANKAAEHGPGILKHVFGEKRSAVEKGLGLAAGLDGNSAGKLMEMLAPMVMGAVKRASHEQGSSNVAAGVMGLLKSEKEKIENEVTPQAGGLLSKLLDQDGDGDLDLGDLTRGLGKLF